MSEATKMYEDKMNKTLNNLSEEYITIRAGRANPHILDKIKVDYYGQPSPIQSVANISVPEARIIQIQPWEASLIKAIEKEINMANLGVIPNNDGKSIRLVFPELTEDRRKELSKDIKKKAENAKIAIRNIRRDAVDHFKKQEKANEITEDDLKGLEDEIQKITDKFSDEIDKMTEDKIKEIMTV
ncbi:ribosome recycling factor [Catonella massiliensis]|jgi:ribosome recycling factor|uniref:Ribosome-recycling factor n=1 Tax=Catonella massiliensis TaxID=2799636 RepID=A0ABS1J059_9FIRM|nr:ribosome recycling factor [Catonella massiliensis]MBF1014689.1 ribosome recycling factor [Lachnospiraceae bacterium]MBK5897314.1 ribosome recycling factor [Catonella massiliensis]